MIKICSLDFLNREEFGTDVMTADGTVLFRADEKVTPETILRLYFKEIYVEESFLKEEPVLAVKSVEVGVAITSVSEEPVLNISSDEIIAEDEVVLSNPTPAEGHLEIKEEPASDLKSAEETVEEVIKEESVSSEPESEPVEIPVEIEETFVLSGPRHVEATVKEEKHTSGPRQGETHIYEKEERHTSGPRHVEVSETEESTKEKEKKHVYSTESSVKKEEVEIINKNPENEQLVFDEKQAKRIVEHSLKLGKLLKFSNNELKELEQVAYYCNVGIDSFKKSDLSKKTFRKLKAFASYEKLLNDGIVPEEIAEMVKFCANDYDSDTFPLNSKIPYHHIVALTSFYEELLSQNDSKQATLLKILQIGGNQFNIFILHKFIKMMRDAND